MKDKTDIQSLKKLAGLDNNRKQDLSGSNISVTGTEKRRIERENNIKPGTDEWFKLWFSLPYMTGENPRDLDNKNENK